MEVETFLTLAVRLEYASEEHMVTHYGLIREISKMLTAMRAKLDA